jgi:hypothetical protein
MTELPDEFIPTRKSLLSRLKHWDDDVRHELKGTTH